MRADKQFETLERYTDLCGLEVPEDSILLLECMSNLAANEMFDESGAKEGYSGGCGGRPPPPPEKSPSSGGGDE